MNIEFQVMSVKDVAEYYGIHEQTVYKLMGEGKIPSFKVGRHRKTRKDILKKEIEMLKNERGFSFWIVFVFIFLLMTGAFAADAERRVLAEDISSGKLKLNDKAKKMIEKGDFFLDRASYGFGAEYAKRHQSIRVAFEEDLYEAFVAKVWYERARLEMELSE